jgi:hypothetical protein
MYAEMEMTKNIATTILENIPSPTEADDDFLKDV